MKFGYLLTDRFGSHVIRNLVLVLSGEPLKDPDTQKILASKRKERLDKQVAGNSQTGVPREVPQGFKTALSHLIEAAVSSLDRTYLRALATHPTGNPVLQVLLKLELTNSDKGRSHGEDSLFHKLFSPDSLADDSEGTKLISGLTYDPTGSHLVELVVQYAPGKIFKKLYKHVWAPRMASMAKNDVASYV
ncbi:MAG: Nucleolar protein 9, partial [Watsoniomyces obsoletus]